MDYLTGRNEYHTYLLRFFAETEKVARADTLLVVSRKGTPNAMPCGVVIDEIMRATTKEQKAIANVISQLDFQNGDVKNFLEFLGQALAVDI